MEILIAGAGAIGCWIGANLLRAGHHVTFVGRGAFVEAVQSRGLQVALPDGGRWSFEPAALCAFESVRAAAEAQYFDATLLCVKSYALAAALDEMHPHAERLGQIVTFQNGVGAEEQAAEIFNLQRMTAGTLTSPISSAAFGEIALDRLGGGVGLADLAPGVGFAERFRRECGGEHMSIEVFADFRAMKWSKMLLNIVGNASSALFDVDVAQVYADPRLFALEMRMVRECVAVMRALKIAVVNLPGYSARLFAWVSAHLPDALARLLLASRVARGRGGKRPSFYTDVANCTGRSEVGALNGRIAEHAAQLGIAAPVNRWLTDELLRRASTPGSRTELPSEL